MTLERLIAAAAIGVFFLSGCNWMNPDYEPFQAEGYRLYVSRGVPDKFWFDVLPDKLKALGGPGSPELLKLLDQVVKQRGICKVGYRITDSGGGKGYHYTAGQCTS